MKNYNLKEIEKQTIKQCLAENPDKTIAEIADLLGISERTLYRRFEEYQVPYSYIVRGSIN